MTFIMFQRGATSWGFQIGRVWWNVFYPTFWAAGLVASCGIEPLRFMITLVNGKQREKEFRSSKKARQWAKGWSLAMMCPIASIKRI